MDSSRFHLHHSDSRTPTSSTELDASYMGYVSDALLLSIKIANVQILEITIIIHKTILVRLIYLRRTRKSLLSHSLKRESEYFAATQDNFTDKLHYTCVLPDL